MNRRQFLGSAAAASAMSLAATMAHAHDAHAHHHHAAASASSVANPYEAVRRSAAGCVDAGQACLAHCVDLLGKGDTSMKDCARAVNQMLAFCGAVQNLAAQQSALLPQLAKICAQACEQCAAACKEHINHHAECKACYESCLKCIEECKKIA